MGTGRALLAVIVATLLCFALAGRAAATIAPDFTFTNASEQATIYTFNSGPLSCTDFPAATDTYVWNLKLAKINGDLIQDLANNPVTVVFNSGSCNPMHDVTNTLGIAPGAPYIHTDSAGLVEVDFTGAVPDFNTTNSSNDVNLPFFDNIVFHLVYNAHGTVTGGLKAGAGTLQVSGNANLCGAITSSQPQCFVLNLGIGETPDTDISCICVTPSVVDIDITSVIAP